ncbi:undecaprenyldiphospho-muramoylpentapeptide beta-N-acetylglucosaminyltransferase [Plantibacter sp. YIM 135249]|uniref:undecaprenyldiphospho-muramoylpentapeptide beta-N-acetylglucosaminyltransferase n=1 Tax=Plantibacter sp. YIM 135249 TaxID=3423918 RepID=UPI003D354A0D
MTTYLLAGGGTAGHVNPLLAVADALRARNPDDTILVVGTKEGLESRLVPERGYELLTIPKLPFPRRPNVDAMKFGSRLRAAVAQVASIITTNSVDVVIGFGGYASAPAYLAARRTRVPLVIHEANAKPGLANRLGARYTPYVGVAFHHTRIRHARFVGMPLRLEIEQLDRDALRPLAVEEFGLDASRPTVLVTGGSLGARRLNTTINETATDLVATGYQILHITGARGEALDPGIPHYHVLDYCSRMELALAITDLAVSRAGSATVSELCAVGVPAVYIPYPVGNGEQRYNAADVVRAGGAVMVDDARFVPDWVRSTLVPLLGDRMRVHDMAAQSKSVGVTDGTARLIRLVDEAIGSRVSAAR